MFISEPHHGFLIGALCARHIIRPDHNIAVGNVLKLLGISDVSELIVSPALTAPRAVEGSQRPENVNASIVLVSKMLPPVKPR
jgi:hypothetical protein